MLTQVHHLFKKQILALFGVKNAQIFSDLVEKYTDIKELNARILNELIDRIVIHEKEIINGEKHQMVEIYYKLVGLV